MVEKHSAGQNIASYCTKCKLGLDHTIVAMDGEVIAKVRCSTCGSRHKFRDPAEALKVRVPRAKKGAGPEATAEIIWDSALATAKGKRTRLQHDLEIPRRRHYHARQVRQGRRAEALHEQVRHAVQGQGTADGLGQLAASPHLPLSLESARPGECKMQSVKGKSQSVRNRNYGLRPYRHFAICILKFDFCIAFSVSSRQ